MYQALYRKWRPRTFDDVVGQEQVTETLKNQIAANRASHAYLFIGVRGTGKTTCAKILARALNCEAPENGNPCNKCKSCVGIESGSVMDVVEIDAASNNGVENVRALREEAVYTPASVKKRVYIIDEVHMLSTSAFNALLKILEEPPEHLVFILATTEIHKVLPTILSRCQRYSFRRISPEAIAARLEYVARQESIALDEDASALLSRLADGSLRDGLSLLDQCSGAERVTAESVLSAMGLAGNFRIAQLLEHIIAEDTAAAIALFESLWQDGKSPSTLLSELVTLLRDVMLLSVAPKGGRELLSGGFDDKTLDSLGKRIRPGEAMEYITLLQERIGRLRDGRDPRIEAELCIIALCNPKLLDSPERLGQRITKLEKAIATGEIPPTPSPPREEAPFPKELEALLTEDSPPNAPAEGDARIVPPAPAPLKDEPPFDMEDKPVVSAEDIRPPEADNSMSETSGMLSDEDIPTQQADTHLPTADGDNLWPALYAQLKSVMPPYHLAHLSGAGASLDGGKLIIFVKGAFAKTSLEKPEPQDLIRKAIKKVMGEIVLFGIEEARPVPGASDRLSELSKFGNVKFE